MADLKDVLGYLKELPTVLQAGALDQQDRTLCYVMQNRLISAIDLDNPIYKTITDLRREAIVSIKEMREDVENMVHRKYKNVPLMEGVLLVDVIEELGKIELVDEHSCKEYLIDLAVTSLVSLQYNVGLEEGIKLVFDTLIYLCIVALNLFNRASNLKPELEGVEISFDRKRKSAV